MEMRESAAVEKAWRLHTLPIPMQLF